MANLGFAKPQPRRSRNAPGNAIIGAAQGSTRQRGHEFLTTIVVPSGATLGQNLYQLEVNPTQFPQLAVFASQYTQWKGNVNLNIEALGNSFAKSAVLAAYIADPDGGDLPTAPADLLRTIESVERQSRTSIHLQDVVTHNLTAPWRVSTNPWKFVEDTDVSDRANGIFVLAALGDPGTDPIVVKISATYDISFQGRKFTPMESALSTNTTAAYGVNNYVGNQPFSPSTGTFSWAYDSTLLTVALRFPVGTIPDKYIGTWTYDPLTPWFVNAIVSPSGVSATSIVNRVYVLSMTVTTTTVVYQLGTALSAPPISATVYTWNIRTRSSAS
jgi:hypothetical protein